MTCLVGFVTRDPFEEHIQVTVNVNLMQRKLL